MFIAIPFINGIVDFICQHFVTLAECAGSGEGSAPNLQREQPQVGAGNPQPGNPPQGEQPAAAVDLASFRGDVHCKLGIFLSGAGRSVQTHLYAKAWERLQGDAASAEQLLAIDLKIMELSLRRDLPTLPRERWQLLIEEIERVGH